MKTILVIVGFIGATAARGDDTWNYIDLTHYDYCRIESDPLFHSGRKGRLVLIRDTGPGLEGENTYLSIPLPPESDDGLKMIFEGFKRSGMCPRQ